MRENSERTSPLVETTTITARSSGTAVPPAVGNAYSQGVTAEERVGAARKRAREETAADRKEVRAVARTPRADP